jgi:hypothetical protein
MITDLSGLHPLPRNCEAGVSVLHAHVYPILGTTGRVALCISLEERARAAAAKVARRECIVTDLVTAESFRLLPGIDCDGIALPLEHDDRRPQ